ncbi:MAG: hypothetical protein COY70_04705, partial [Candidatus Magasanikbacteria bacterium CG_4_10_14_0_8_um_filter_42_12]
IAILGVGWWLLSPLFIDKKVDEELDPKVASALDFVMSKAGQGLQKAGEKLADTKTTDLQKKVAELKASMDNGSNLDEQITDEDTMNQFMEEMSQMEDTDMSEDMMDVANPKELATGAFVTVAHEGTGNVRLIKLGDGSDTIVRLENLDVLNGPDLRVVLSKSSDVEKAGHLGEYIELGALKGNKGNQNYVVPADADVSEYNSVVIYCKAFRVVFNSANLVTSK